MAAARADKGGEAAVWAFMCDGIGHGGRKKVTGLLDAYRTVEGKLTEEKPFRA